MTHRVYSFFVGFIAVLNACLFGTTLLFINPEQSGPLGLLFFYASLLLFLFGTIYFLSYAIHMRFLKWTSLFKNIQVSTRQSLLFSILIVGSLSLQGLRLLTWYNLIFFVLILTAVEFLFLSRKKPITYGRKIT